MNEQTNFTFKGLRNEHTGSSNFLPFCSLIFFSLSLCPGILNLFIHHNRLAFSHLSYNILIAQHLLGEIQQWQ